MRESDTIPRPNNTHTHTHTMWTIRRPRDSLTHRQWLRNYYIKYDHRAQCLFPIQVVPGHVNEPLTKGTEKVKAEILI